MLQALNLDFRQVGNILYIAPDIVTIQNRDDLVIGFTVIDHLNAAQHASPQQYL